MAKLTDAEKFEALVAEIMKECAADGEPVTREEAIEMAEMEMKSRKDCKLVVRPVSVAAPQEKRKNTRKVDEDKKELIEMIHTLIDGCANNEPDMFQNVTVEKENKVHFSYNGNEYTINLIKHRPPKTK